jgi:hypothetical protein
MSLHGRGCRFIRRLSGLLMPFTLILRGGTSANHFLLPSLDEATISFRLGSGVIERVSRLVDLPRKRPVAEKRISMGPWWVRRLYKICSSFELHGMGGMHPLQVVGSSSASHVQ